MGSVVSVDMPHRSESSCQPRCARPCAVALTVNSLPIAAHARVEKHATDVSGFPMPCVTPPALASALSDTSLARPHDAPEALTTIGTAGLFAPW